MNTATFSRTITDAQQPKSYIEIINNRGNLDLNPLFWYYAVDMKKDIHPPYFKKAKALDASSGETIEVGSTQEEISIEMSYLSHPFYTGKEQLIDTAGRVDRFKKMVEKQSAVAATRKGKKVKKEKLATKKSGKKAESTAKILKPKKAADIVGK